MTTDEPDSGSKAYHALYEPGEPVWVGRSRGSERDGASCAISAKAPTAWLSSDMRGQGLCMRASFTRAEKTKRAEVPPLFTEVPGETIWKFSDTGQTPHHQTDHGRVDERLTGGA